MLVGEMELPSIYVDGTKVWRLDHLTASVDAKGQLTVGNPTAYSAKVRIQWCNGAIIKTDLAPAETKMIK
jgi:hypothetical protein